jgi:hypothetical protein
MQPAQIPAAFFLQPTQHSPQAVMTEKSMYFILRSLQDIYKTCAIRAKSAGFVNYFMEFRMASARSG